MKFRIALIALLHLGPTSGRGSSIGAIPSAISAALSSLRWKAVSPKTHLETPNKSKNIIIAEYVDNSKAHCTLS